MDLQFNTYQDDPIFNGYVAFPDLSSQSDPQPNRTDVASPTFAMNGNGFHSELPGGQNFTGGGSLIYSSFSAYAAELNSSGWKLTTDADTGSANTYTFDVNAAAITAFGAVPALIDPGFQGFSFAEGSSPTFTWTGPTGFDSLDVNLYNLSDPNANQGMSLSANALSYSPAVPLSAGDYQFYVTYTKDVSGAITATTPVDQNSNQLSNWAGILSTSEKVSDRVTFTVVPEPGSALLFLGGAVVFAAARSRRAARL